MESGHGTAQVGLLSAAYLARGQGVKNRKRTDELCFPSALQALCSYCMCIQPTISCSSNDLKSGFDVTLLSPVL